MPLIDYQLTPENGLSITQDAIDHAIDITGNLLIDTGLHTPYRLILESQVYIYSEFVRILSEMDDEIRLIFFDLLDYQSLAARSSRVTLKFEIPLATQNTYIPKGYPVRSNNGIIFSTDDVLIIPTGSQIGYVSATALTPGSDGNVPEFTINQPVKDLSFFFSVTNELPAVDGIDGESFQDIEFRVTQDIRKSGLITESDYRAFVRDFVPSCEVSAHSPEASIVNVYVSYEDGTPLSATDFTIVNGRLQESKMLGIVQLNVGALELLEIEVKVIAGIKNLSDADQISESIREALIAYLKPSNERFTIGQSRGIVLVNEVERQLAPTELDHIQSVQIGLTDQTLYTNNFAFNPLNQRVKLTKLSTDLIIGDNTVSRVYE